MVDKISIEIGLEGGTEVKQQLDDISGAFTNVGGAGQAAFNKVQAAAESASVLEGVYQSVKKVEGAFDALGNAVTKMATRMTRSLGVFGVLARSLGPVGVAVGVLTSLMVKAENDIASATNALLVSATKVGLTVPKFDQLRKTLLQFGVSADAINPGLQALKEALKDDFFGPNVFTGFQNIIAQLERMPDGVERNTLAFAQLEESLGAEVIAGSQAGTLTAANFATALAGITPATQEQIIQAAKYRQTLNSLSNAWTQFKAEIAAPLITPALEWLTTQLPGIAGGIQATVQEFKALWDIINQVGTVGAQVIGALVNAVLAVGRAAKWAADQLALMFASKPPASSGSDSGFGAEGFAGGGLLGGSGTGTSDSNLAWVSRGEYITPAAAVAQPGVLAFLEALRRSGGNLSRVLDGMGRFALGGLVRSSMPAFASGGLAGGSNVTIAFPGLPPIGGLRASSDVVEQLHRAAALAQVRSGGRKPSRYA